MLRRHTNPSTNPATFLKCCLRSGFFSPDWPCRRSIRWRSGWRRKLNLTCRVQRLRTQYGIGPLTGLCLAHTLECPERFANPRKVTAYVGFDPVEDSSGQWRRIGSISKQGSRLLRFLLVEAGQIAIRKDQELARVYKRVFIRRGHAKAKVAIGRRLLVRVFIMLRDEIDCAEFQRRGVAAQSSRGIA